MSMRRLVWIGALVAAPALGAGATPADLDGDGTVGAADLEILLNLWGHVGSVADINRDGIVDVWDLASLLAAWGR